MAPSDVKTVRNGVLKGYNSTTVGKAFEGTFRDTKWTTFETPKGVTVVEFNGTINADVLWKADFRPSGQGMDSAHETCHTSFGQFYATDPTWLACFIPLIQKVPIPVNFQFFLSADKQTFKVGYMDSKPFARDLDAVLAFVYR